MTNPLRLATIGTSSITERWIAAAHGVDGLAVTTAYSRDRARAEAFAAANGVPRWSADLDGLLGSDEIDAVYLATPNGLHLETALAAVRAGTHVLVEKPAVPTVVEWEFLVAEAAAHGVVVLEAMRNVHDPGMAAIRGLLPELGTLRLASFAVCQRSARYDLVLAGERVNIFDPELAGGALLDLGVYPIAAMIELFGEPSAVSGSGIQVASGADGAGSAVLGYDGFVGTVAYSKITASERPNEIQGETGTLLVDRIDLPRRLTLQLHDGSTRTVEVDGETNNLGYETWRFVDLVRGDADAAADHARTLATLRVVDALRGVH
ncbi:Gfo/Idh/MocA family protein [Agromyces seonyuensis]|uniref:Gfo/Idh/MocA family oxidoreductase n=1 Tax=Agromyces seonyuensis TaxID=2662446 RepID=A0A6I4P2I6_9MICO|nr:Gfo/Idh/MocA family oxidoreductase [Agromyces seonyuensis]MWB97414.1 gfo/Idh/MocA family oxidoreductase [Agromyces seonyuensis]